VSTQNIFYTSREQLEVYKFAPLVIIVVPLLAIGMQSFIFGHLGWLGIIDLPLIVTIFFAVARRNPVAGLLTGCLIGLLQDALAGNQPIGVYGICKTIIGYAASSIGAKIDVDNPGSRFLMTFVFYMVHQVLYFGIRRGMLRDDWMLSWQHLLIGAVANGVVAVVIFALLDKFKKRA
jgi:rod shape-determining protein MreD